MMHALEKVDMSYLERAPNVVQSSVQIDATPAEIFNALEKPETWVEAVGPMTALEWTSPTPFDVGTTRTVYLDMPQGKIQVDEVFIAWEQDRRMAFYFSHTNKKLFNALLEDYLVTDLGDGRSELTWKFAYEGAGINRLLFWLIKGKLKKDNQQALVKMKAVIESNH